MEGKKIMYETAKNYTAKDLDEAYNSGFTSAMNIERANFHDIERIICEFMNTDDIIVMYLLENVKNNLVRINMHLANHPVKFKEEE